MDQTGVLVCQVLHEQYSVAGALVVSSSSRTSANVRVVAYRSKDPRAGSGEALGEMDEPEDLDECPRDHTETVDEVVDAMGESGA